MTIDGLTICTNRYEAKMLGRGHVSLHLFTKPERATEARTSVGTEDAEGLVQHDPFEERHVLASDPCWTEDFTIS